MESKPTAAPVRLHYDLCGVEPPAVLCCTGDTALCLPCDGHLHRCNNKHRHLILTSSAPLCDVCQEEVGLVMCNEERAILCAACDDRVHGACEHMAKHSRFLLVGSVDMYI